MRTRFSRGLTAGVFRLIHTCLRVGESFSVRFGQTAVPPGPRAYMPRIGLLKTVYPNSDVKTIFSNSFTNNFKMYFYGGRTIDSLSRWYT